MKKTRSKKSRDTVPLKRVLQVPMLVAHMNCRDVPVSYFDYENATSSVMADTLDCRVGCFHDIHSLVRRQGYFMTITTRESTYHGRYHELALQMKKGPVRIQYKFLVKILVFLEMKLQGSLFPNRNYNFLFPNFHIHVSVSDLYIPRIGQPILLQPNKADRSWEYINRSRIHECRNWE
jgi:hypothetical protein